MTNNVVLGVDSLSSRDERMSSEGSSDGERIKEDVNMKSDAEIDVKQERMFSAIVTSTCVDPSPIKVNPVIINA